MVYSELKDKVAVVTGGSKGIGTAISERFGKEGILTITQIKRVLKKLLTLLRKMVGMQ